MLGGPVRSAGSDRVRGFPRVLLEKFVVGRAVRFPPRPAAWTGVERLISECGEETVVSECGARCFSGGQARKTCPPEYRRPGGGRPSRLDFFSPGRLPFPSNVMGYGWSRLRCMGSGSRTRVRAVRREELPHGVGAYFAAESRSGSDGGAEASEIGISVCASSPARIRPPCRRGRANGGKPGCGPVVSDRLPGQKDRSIRFRLRPGP